MNDDVSLRAVAFIAGGLVLVAVVFGTLYAQRLRERGRRVPVAITSNVAFGWALILAITVLLVSQAFGNG